ncbi:hypothetical protein Tco_0838072 [Tanacetum coccineum]
MVTIHGVQVQLVMGELRTELGMLIQVKQGKLSATTATENGVALDEEQLLFIAGGQDNAVDEDVDEQPIRNDEVGPSYASDVLSEVHDNDHYQDVVCEHHEIHEMHDDNKVAIGYKNPLCLTRAKQVQPALYNGHEIIKTNHVPAIVHNSEDTLEIAEITRKKMNDKIKDPECVKREFEKTCKKRITPTGLTERERGFEQTKECYLTEVIPFFKTLKEHFEGIQKALTKEIKEMKDIFEELEAEVDQNDVNRKHDEIERKNILIPNDNLIVD